MITIPIWWFILSIILSVLGVAVLIWFIITIIVYFKEYRDSL